MSQLLFLNFHRQGQTRVRGKASWEREQDKGRHVDQHDLMYMTPWPSMGRAGERQSRVMGNVQRQSGNPATQNPNTMPVIRARAVLCK